MKTFQFITLMIMICAGQMSFAQRTGLKDYDRAIDLIRQNPFQKPSPAKRTETFQLDSFVCYNNFNVEWEVDNKELYSYDDEGRLVKDSSFTWFGEIPEGMGWVMEHKNEYSYYPNGLLYETVSLVWAYEIEDWTLDTLKTTNIYEGDRLVKVINSFYDSEFMQWDESVLDSLIYDSNGLLQGRIAGFFFENEFVPVASVEYDYKAGMLTAETFQFTFDGGELWIPLFRELYQYDDDLLEAKTTQVFDEELEEFIDAVLSLYAYDENDLLMQTQIYSWQDEWFLISLCDYYYSKRQSTSAPVVIRDSVQVLMSNPFNGGEILLQAAEGHTSIKATIINMQGQVVYHGSISGNKIELPGFTAPGMYLLMIQNNDATLAIKRFIATAH